MSEFNLDPRDHIDRKAEQELFSELVTFEKKFRILTMCDKGGTGKSSLLKRLVYNCHFVIKPSVPVCLIELDRLESPLPYEIVKKVVDGLKIERKDEKFLKYLEKEAMRVAKAITLFGKSGNINTTAEVKGPMETGAIAAGYYAAGPTNIKNSEFTADQEHLAQQICIKVFFDDLREICKNEKIVLIFDAWEKFNIEQREWIVHELLEKGSLNTDIKNRINKLGIVIAGRPYSADERFGIRHDEFSELFERIEDHDATIKSVKALSKWDKDHVKQFMVLNGYSNCSDLDALMIQEKLAQGMTLEKAAGIINLMKSS